ncbi:MAG: hypothetical protein IT428_06020 [Planctomycetaceae bacterium]|nr:hypothetical protein [Planctomycetaceae bacterium]
MQWIANLLQQAGKLRMAQDAVMTDDLQQVLRNGREAHKAYQRTMLGPEFPKASDSAPGDDVIAIDSPTTVTHHHAPPVASSLAKVAMAFAVAGPLGAGIAAGMAAIPVVSHWLNKPATQTTAPATAATASDSPQPTIKQSTYWLELVPPK